MECWRTVSDVVTKGVSEITIMAKLYLTPSLAPLANPLWVSAGNRYPSSKGDQFRATDDRQRGFGNKPPKKSVRMPTADSCFKLNWEDGEVDPAITQGWSPAVNLCEREWIDPRLTGDKTLQTGSTSLREKGSGGDKSGRLGVGGCSPDYRGAD